MRDKTKKFVERNVRPGAQKGVVFFPRLSCVGLYSPPIALMQSPVIIRLTNKYMGFIQFFTPPCLKHIFALLSLKIVIIGWTSNNANVKEHYIEA
jgi:hypothetical protein